MNFLGLYSFALVTETDRQKNLRLYYPPFRQEQRISKSLEDENKKFYYHLAKLKINKNRKRKHLSSSNLKRRMSLIIAPHPDDEILGAGNLIKKKVKSNEEVKVVFVTDGEAMDSHIGEVMNYQKARRNESQKALQKIGIKSKNIYFLGFPDAYLDKLPNETKITSSFSRENKTASDSYLPNLAFSKTNLMKALDKIIKENNPNEIYFTSSDDTHPDHYTIGKIMEEITIQKHAKKLSYSIHKKNCLNEICSCNKDLDEKKLNLIKIFESQRHSLHHEKFLDQFACQKEEFSEVK